MASHPICPSAAGSSAPNLSSSGLLKAATSRATFPDSSGKPVSASSAWTPATSHASPNVAATASGARPFPSPDPNAMHSAQHPNRDAEPADHGACLFRPAPAQSTPCSGSEPNRPAACAHARRRTHSYAMPPTQAGRRYVCVNFPCRCEIELVRPPFDRGANPRCACGAEMKKPFSAPVLRRIHKQPPEFGFVDQKRRVAWPKASQLC